MPSGGYVVTGGARGVGRAIAERLFLQGPVVVIDVDESAEEALHAYGFDVVVGDAADPVVAQVALARLGRRVPLAGWVNDAAVFRDADLADGADVLTQITANLAPAVIGTAAAVRRFADQGTGGAIVNVSSHQAQRPVRGALAYATAKAAIEGLTRAAAVDHGPHGVRVNAIALGSIVTARSEQHEAQLGEEADAFRDAIAGRHPLGRAGLPREAAEVAAFLLSDAASFITGAVLPVDGGRAAYGPDPEERDPA